jgi:hypothetical protein
MIDPDPLVEGLPTLICIECGAEYVGYPNECPHCPYGRWVGR